MFLILEKSMFFFPSFAEFLDFGVLKDLKNERSREVFFLCIPSFVNRSRNARNI